MKDEEMNRNIGLAFDLLREVADNPIVADAIPSGSAVRFVKADNEETLNVPFVVRTPRLLEKGFAFTFSRAD